MPIHPNLSKEKRWTHGSRVPGSTFPLQHFSTALRYDSKQRGCLRHTSIQGPRLSFGPSSPFCYHTLGSISSKLKSGYEIPPDQNVSFTPIWMLRESPEPTIGLPAITSGVPTAPPNAEGADGSLLPPLEPCDAP